MRRPRNRIAADVVRVADGVLAEHWESSKMRRLVQS